MRRVCAAIGLVLLSCGACGDSAPQYARAASAGHGRDGGAPDEVDAAQYQGDAPSGSSKPPPLHGAAGAGGTSGGGGAGAAAEGGAPAPAGLVLPDVEPARYAPDARKDHDCTDVPGVTSFYAP